MRFHHFIQLVIPFWFALLVSSSNIGNDRQDIDLSDDGGYMNILIAISDKVPENRDVISNIQKYFKEASNVLFTATKGRMYFKNLTILVPPTWQTHYSWSQSEDEEIYERARIIVAKENLGYGDIPYTLQPGKCGVEGDYIHFTPRYFIQVESNEPRYKPAKKIVREFSKLKWGLFDEDLPPVDTTTPRFYQANEQLHGVGCVQDFSFRFKEQSDCMDFDESGAFPLPCDLIVEEVFGTASMLSFEYLDNVAEFCSDDGDDGVRHNPVAENLQNINCDGRSAWEVMKSLDDFAVDYSINRRDEVPSDPEFRIVQFRKPIATTTTNTPTTITDSQRITTTESLSSSTTSGPQAISPIPESNCQQDIVCLCLDVSGSMSINNRIGVMSDSVKLYILNYLRNGTAVGIVAFSSSEDLRADMTEISNSDVRDTLVSVVPTSAGGGTNIAAGVNECRRILENYAGEGIDKTRIVLLSDGEGTIDDSITLTINDGIMLDTILYGQGGYLADRADETGGQQFFASDTSGEKALTQFFADSASRGCDAEDSDAVLSNGEITIAAGETFYNGTIDFDITIGLNTKVVFRYSKEINVTFITNQTVTLTKNAELGTITTIIEGIVEDCINYVITKLVDQSQVVTVGLTVSSSPVPGVEPIVINNRVNSNSIQFNEDTQVIGYLGVFQGLSPVLQLTANIAMEQPDGSLLTIAYVDDGTGVDSVPNDGIYTGFAPAHQIGGGGGTYYGLTIAISGEGVLPTQGASSGSRRKRCVDCESLGNVTRSTSGGVIVIENWVAVEDTTPPQKITDLRVVKAAAEGDLFTLEWTAPGDDLNIGQAVGYEFAVGNNVLVDSLVSLTPDAILSNVSNFIVDAGTILQMRINVSVITPTMFGLNESANISTYYIRMKTYDDKNNFAAWSNPASVSKVNPSIVADLLAPSTTTTMAVNTTSAAVTTTTTSTHTRTHTTNEEPPATVETFGITPGIIGGIAGGAVLIVAIIIGVVIVKCTSSKRWKVQRNNPGYDEEEMKVPTVVE